MDKLKEVSIFNKDVILSID
ncbi:unnamed protein product [Priceomyces carsonii]|nr:unnamed protein product [Priceomyces carsonii]